jgi:hypothetical protein
MVAILVLWQDISQGNGEMTSDGETEYSSWGSSPSPTRRGASGEANVPPATSSSSGAWSDCPQSSRVRTSKVTGYLIENVRLPEKRCSRRVHQKENLVIVRRKKKPAEEEEEDEEEEEEEEKEYVDELKTTTLRFLERSKRLRYHVSNLSQT